MQLEQNIPTLGGLGEPPQRSRREPLAADGARAPRARDPRLLARLIGGPSELLSSVELSREDPRGVSTELLSMLHLRAAESARKIDVDRVLPATSLRWPLLALVTSGLIWAVVASLAPRYVSRGVLRLWAGE